MSSKMQNTKKCAGCARDLLTTEQLKCNTCSLKYHYDCLNFTNKKFKDISQDYKNSWVCPSCRSKLPKSDNSNTPIRGTGSTTDECSSVSNITFRRTNPVVNMEDGEELTLTAVKQLIQESMDSFIDKIEQKIRKIVELKTKEIFKEVNDVKDSICYLNTQYEDIKTDLQLKCNQMKKLSEENDNLKTTIKDLGNRLTIMEQQTRMCNIELQCLPEHKTENLVTIVTQIASVSGMKLQEGDIFKCTRIAKINPDNKRPRSVVVRFSTPRIRDTFMASVKQYNRKHRDNKLNTSHIGIGGEKKPIFVVDHLSPEIKKIHALARETAKKLQYKFVWTKNGRVFMRKTETSEHIMIRKISQLESLS